MKVQMVYLGIFFCCFNRICINIGTDGAARTKFHSNYRQYPAAATHIKERIPFFQVLFQVANA